jgi:hypothetical protein
MKATELRIGNLVKGKEINVYWTVEAIDTHSIFSYGKWRSLDAFEPIPLTEDFLLKFGFYRHIKLSNHNGWLLNGWFINSKNYDFMVLGSSVVLAKINHVHQLQNIYHALEGEELTLKNTHND